MKRSNYLSIIVGVVCILLILVGCESTISEETTSLETSREKIDESIDGEFSASEDIQPEATDLTVFTAASLSNVMEKIKEMHEEEQTNVNIIYNADSSGTLQKQIEQGATCDIFFSAAMKQMDALTEGGYVDTDTVVHLLENKVVLIKSKGVDTKVTGFDNISEANSLALAGEDVPVGQYAREIFQNMGTYDDIMAMEINECVNVTAVLTSVSEQSNEVGVTYATDAASMPNSVEVIAYAPDGPLNTPVVYPVGLVYNTEASEAEIVAAKDFVEFLQTEKAMKVFEEYGFVEYKE